MFSGPTYVVRCREIEQSSSRTLACERVLVASEAAKLAPGADLHASFARGPAQRRGPVQGGVRSSTEATGAPSAIEAAPAGPTGSGLPQSAFRVANAVYAALGRARPDAESVLVADATAIWTYVKSGSTQEAVIAAAKIGMQTIGADASIEQILAVGIPQTR